MYKFSKLFMVILSIFILTISSTAYSNARIINIGIMQPVKNEENADALELFRRYNLAYLNEITKHTHWRYKFTYLSPAECLRQLNNGALDLIAPIDPAAFTNQNYVFSQGASNYALLSLYVREDNDTLTATARSMRGTRIGYLDISRCKDMLNLFLRKNEWHAVIVPYATGEELAKALQTGEVDAIVDTSANLTGHEKYLTFVNAVAQQFMTTPDKADIIHDLNMALLKIKNSNPSFDTHVRDEYLNPAIYMLAKFSESELNYMEKAPAIRVVFPRELAPLVSQNRNTGVIEGIFPDFLKLLEKHSSFKFGLLMSNSVQDARDMLNNGTADAMFAIYTNRKQDDKEYFSNNIYWMSFDSVAVRGRKSTEPPKVIVVPSFFPGMKERLAMSYPHSGISELDSIQECIYAVEQGYADVAFIPSAFLAKDRTILMHFNLDVVENGSISLPLCIMISNRQPELLNTAINTTLLSLQQMELDKIVAKNSDPDVSITYIMEKHPVMISTSLLLLFIVLTPTIILFNRRRLEQQEAETLAKKNIELKAALDRMKEIEKMRDSYKLAAETDKLTGCYNKTAMIEHSQTVLEKLVPNWEAAFFVIDLDHFKEANDTYGHQHGDAVLIAFSNCLREILPPYSYLGRFGGDEFTILIIHPQVRERAETLAKHIVEKTRALTVNGKNAKVTASIGIAIATQMASDKETLSLERDIARLFSNADQALYLVKQNGRDNYSIYE